MPELRELRPHHILKALLEVPPQRGQVFRHGAGEAPCEFINHPCVEGCHGSLRGRELGPLV